MQSRAEVTSRYAKAYVKASKSDKGRVLDEVVSVTGWSRDVACQRDGTTVLPRAWDHLEVLVSITEPFFWRQRRHAG